MIAADGFVNGSFEATPFCNSGGLLPGHVNHDCCVDRDDLMMMAAMRIPAGLVSFFDLAALGDNRLAGSLQEQESDRNCDMKRGYP